MNIYFSGIGGVGLGPLAEIARDAGHTVSGSDAKSSPITEELAASGIALSTDQSGDFLASQHESAPIDWFIYTAALSSDHPELQRARELGIKTGKRDELINEIISTSGLKLIAVAGTHGKTTTTAMLVWTLQQLGIPVSYSIGTTLSWGPSGRYDPEAEFFVYECDEFDRNFLHFSPALSLITSIDYDHPDTYPTKTAYTDAFTQFLALSSQVIMWQHDTTAQNVVPPSATWQLNDTEVMDFTIAGVHNRRNATLVVKACEYLQLSSIDQVQAAVTSFPGSARRFERLSDNLFTDYGHHPVEIAATLQMARELSDHVVLVYQPHQNTRQHTIRDSYTSCMELAETIYWLPTYQTREDSQLPILTPHELSGTLTNNDAVIVADLNKELWRHMQEARSAGKLVLCMGAGSIDGWVRQQLATSN